MTMTGRRVCWSWNWWSHRCSPRTRRAPPNGLRAPSCGVLKPVSRREKDWGKGTGCAYLLIGGRLFHVGCLAPPFLPGAALQLGYLALYARSFSHAEVGQVREA